jgi:hypothetical protein
MWDDISPSIHWVTSQLPNALRKVRGSFSNMQTLSQVRYLHCINASFFNLQYEVISLCRLNATSLRVLAYHSEFALLEVEIKKQQLP